MQEGINEYNRFKEVCKKLNNLGVFYGKNYGGEYESR